MRDTGCLGDFGNEGTGTGFSWEVTPLFDNMLVQALEEVGILQADAQPIPIPTEPSTFKPQKKHKPKRKHTKEPEVSPTESQVEHNVPLPSPSHDALPSGEDCLKLKELMDLCTNLFKKVLDLKSEVIDIKSTYKVKFEKLESNVERLKEENRPAGVEEMLEVVTYSKLITEVVTTVGVDVNVASVQDTPITAAKATKVTIEAPKPRKRRGVIIQDLEETITTVTSTKDEEVARQLEAELNVDINWNVVIKQVKRSERLTDAIVPDDDDDDVYADATPLALKIPIVDYKIHIERNRPYFKIIIADGNHRPYFKIIIADGNHRLFSTMMKNFNREDIESLWKIVRERFEKTEPKNYTDDYLLNTLKIMFEKHNVEANVWKDQKGKYGLAKVKSSKLFNSCGVHCLNISTTHIFLLVEKMYHLTHFTLEQMVNDVRLEVDYESEMSLELLRLVRRLLNEGYVPQ
nr:hypothetical protein [Tanacetum cinerariifolium]